ncbi:cation-translocating P-type ATPase [Segetibacter koreensis]|uniref:cation-translocating P-type ATPase n=1 Tax=Segetibacter koreensis TaxID=398037 RepID=UPI00037DBF1A|nr:cation-transporting P-type ATPase [Segetibacter koreensis]
MNNFSINILQLLSELKTDADRGLTNDEVSRRLKNYGYNRIKTVNKRSTVKIFREQFKNLLVLLLIGAAILSLFLGSYRDSIILILVVLFNAAIGFYQDFKSENILASLKDLVIQKCIVLRGGNKMEIPSEELVPGDIVYLNEGDGVPADIRLIDSTGLQVNEFILTGESQPAEKAHDFIATSADTALIKQGSYIFMGTTVAKGMATGVVIATGMETQLGKIAHSSGDIDASKTPLQSELDIVAKKISYATIVIATALLAGILLTGETVNNALIFAIGVAAAMVPEGLPAQISVSLALGVSRLAKNKAVVKKLSAVEALGAATVIATDKTGTITKNEMSIIHAHFNGKDFTIASTGYEPKGEIFDVNGTRVFKDNLSDEKIFFLSGFLSSTGKVNPPDKFHASWYAIGDPTEVAFSTLMMKAGFDITETEAAYSIIQIFPFDSFRKRISIVRKHKGKHIAFIKGSIESMVEISARTIIKGVVREFYPEEKEQLLNQAKVYASQSKRIIAIGYKDLEVKQQYSLQETENDIVFAGYATMIDPPHEEVPDAFKTAFKAGLKVVMITGDNEITARAIADSIGMHESDGRLPEVINDKMLKNLRDDEIKQFFKNRTLIFSRVSPDEKLRIVSLLKSSGEVVAVTGDGVNDTLSLKKADIGVAMAKNGSKVAQEAASVVLLDDNFSTIVLAIKEGRTIYGNLKKIVLANLIGNLAELLCVLIGFFGAFYGYPLVIMPVQILLIDLIGNMLPLLMVSFDLPEDNLMQQSPRKQGEMLNKESFLVIAYSGLLKGLFSFFAFYQSYQSHTNDSNRHAIAVTVTMASIIVCQFINILSSRTRYSVFTPFLLTNKNLYIAFFISLAFLLLISYVPLLNTALHAGPLTASDWHYVLMGAGAYLIVLELLKVIRQKFSSNPIKEKMLFDVQRA